VRTLVIAGLLIIALGISSILLRRESVAVAGDSVQAPEYHCPMHPAYVTDKRGNCPVCGMELVPRHARVELANYQSGVPDRSPVEIRPEQRRSLGVSVTEARMESLRKTIHASGRVTMPPPVRLLSELDGAVDQVYRNPASPSVLRIRAADPILAVSPRDPNASGAARAPVIVRAPAPLALLSVAQSGQRVEKGREVCLYIDLSTIFVTADIRSADLPFLAQGLAAQATLPAYPGRVWHGKIVEGSQQFDERMQTLKVKLQFSNAEPDVWAGMFADVVLQGAPRRLLAIPDTALIADGQDTFVYVARKDDMLEPRKIETGIRSMSLVEVKRGLSQGEKVVTSGTFLLDAESRLKTLGRSAAER
jgi:Cu(I)/Ag(I) efflux system membrane fusion protein